MLGCQEEGTLVHELIKCTKNDGVGTRLLHCLQLYVPDIDAQAVLRLDHGEVDEGLSLPLTLMTGIVCNSVWKERDSGVAIQSYKVRADIEQYITLLRTSRLQNAVALLYEMSQNMFN